MILSIRSNEKQTLNCKRIISEKVIQMKKDIKIVLWTYIRVIMHSDSDENILALF